MPEIRVPAAFIIAFMLAGFAAAPSHAQSAVGSEAIGAANDAAGTAIIFASRFAPGDSLIVSVEDATLTSEALQTGSWRLGGREETPRVVGRAIGEAIRSGLAAQSPVKTIVVDVFTSRAATGEDTPLPAGGARVRFYYPIADPAAR